MKRLITFFFAGCLLALVAVLAAFASMRLAIHGREVDVPRIEGLEDKEAAAAVRKLGLNLSVENRFYSAGIAPNHVLSQSPVAGTLVRRGGEVRVTESLGGQKITIPEVTGQTERPAALVLRRLQLEVGNSAHIPAPGQPGTVLAQSPPPNSGALYGPKISLLIADSASEAPPQAYVMPSLINMTVAAANLKLASAGLHIASAQDPTYAAPPAPDPDPTADPAIPPTIVAPPPVSQNAVITSQSPAAGHRITRADNIRVAAHVPSSASPPLP